MKAEERRKLTWEDATERFLDVAELKPGERPKAWEEACDKMAWNAYNSISGACTPYVRPKNPHARVGLDLGIGVPHVCLYTAYTQLCPKA